MYQFDGIHFLMFFLGSGFGLGVIWFFYRAKANELAATRSELTGLRTAKDELIRSESRLAAREAELETLLQEEIRASAEKQKLLEDAQAKLTDTFRALSAEALKSNQESFLQLAKTTLEKYQESAKGDLEKRQQAFGELVTPVKVSLEKMNESITGLEKNRTGAYESLKQQVASMSETQRLLQKETSQLVKALRQPTVRGQWGEIQLKRVVELAGMQEHCDFSLQESTPGSEGRLRPDLVVRLPGKKTIVVDAKTPLSAYLEAVEAKEEQSRKTALQRHARQVRDHVKMLGAKDYQDQFQPSPEFVVLFLPGDPFFSVALEQDPGLIEFGVDQGVILATPTTLIALLRAVAYGWRQESLTENAREISDLGRTLYDRLGVMTRHLTRLGKNIGGAVDSYNKALGTLETRVLASARKFKDLEVAPKGKELESPAPVETLTREIAAPELLQEGAETGEYSAPGEGEEHLAGSSANDTET